MKQTTTPHPIRTAFSASYYAKTPQPSMRKLPLVAQQATDAGFATLVEPRPASRADLERIHRHSYVESILSGNGPLSECAFGFWSEAYRDGVLAINGGNLLATRMALQDGTAQFSKTLPNLFNFSICGSTMGAFEGPRSIVRKVPATDEPQARCYLDEALSLISEKRPGLVIYQAGMDPHCDDPLSRSKMSADFLARRDALVMETLALELSIPFFFVLAGGYQEPMEEKLVPLHVRTFEIAAKTKHIATARKFQPTKQTNSDI